jgi:hypothetical protein
MGNGQIAPGKYFSPAPYGGSTCYYARLVPLTWENVGVEANILL